MAKHPPLTLRQLERAAYQEAIERTGGNVTQLAKELDVDRRTAYRYIQSEGLERALKAARRPA